MLWIDFSKNILILSKNFLNFWFDVIEKQSIINLSLYLSKGYASVVLGCSEVTFLREKEDAAFYPSLYCVLVIYGLKYQSPHCSFKKSTCKGGYSIQLQNKQLRAGMVCSSTPRNHSQGELLTTYQPVENPSGLTAETIMLLTAKRDMESKLLSISLFVVGGIMVSAVSQMQHQDLVPSGTLTYLTLFTLPLHFIPENF